MNTEEKAYNPSSHLIQISTKEGKKDYLPVAWRLRWFRDVNPEGTIETEILHLDLDREVTHEASVWNNDKRSYERVTVHGKGIAIFRATVKDGKGGIATGTKQENQAAFDDFIEKSETGSIGRALAALGYGTQFTGDELDEGQDRIADAPVERKPSHDLSAPCTDQQIDTIRRLQKQLGTTELASVEGLTFGDCAQMLKDLQARLAAKRKAS